MIRLFLTIAVFVVAYLHSVPSSHAARNFWTGASFFTNDWSDSGNWLGLFLPTSDGTDSIAYKDVALGARLTSSVNTNWNIVAINFIQGDGGFVTPSYNIVGPGDIIFSNTVDDSAPGIFNEISASQTISAPIRLNYPTVHVDNRDSIAEGGVKGRISLSSAIDLKSLTLKILPGTNGISSTGSIFGAGSLVVGVGEGAFTLAGSNTFRGGTTLSGTLRTGASNVIPEGRFSIGNGGLLDLTGHAETIGPGGVNETGLFMRGGSDLIAGSLLKIGSLGDFIHYRPGTSGQAGGRIRNGTMSLSASIFTRVFRIEDNPSAFIDLDISANIINQAVNPDNSSPAIRQTADIGGGGRMRLSGANTFWRSIHVENGSLRATSDTALGHGLDTANTGTRVEPTDSGQEASLELFGGINIATEHLTLTGAGVGGAGALQSIIGDNTWGGQVVLTGDSTVRVIDDSLTIGGVISGSSDLLKTGSGMLRLEATNTNSGELRVSDGVLSGNGSYGGNVIVDSGGTLAPGASAGVFTTDDVDFNAGSTFAVELMSDGGVAGTDFDQLVINNSAAIDDATLDVELFDGFTPEPGEQFHILNYGGSAGGTGFSTLNLPVLSADLLWNTSDLLTTGILSVVANTPGDFDFDGDVDGADFLTWQRDQGVGSLADWQTNYGEGAPQQGASSAVPEPSSVMLLVSLAAIIVLSRPR